MKTIILLALASLTFAAHSNVVTPAEQIAEILEFKTYGDSNCSFTFTKVNDSVQIKAQNLYGIASLTIESAEYGRLNIGQRLFSWSGKGHFLTRMVDSNRQYMVLENFPGAEIECIVNI